MVQRLEGVLRDQKPDWAVVFGDTNSTLAGALAAAKIHIPVAHVEAGLRSHNRTMPEEINRVLTDHVASLLYCPTETAVRNLEKEGFERIAEGGRLVGHASLLGGFDSRKPLVANVGDIMCDALHLCLDIAEATSTVLAAQGLSAKAYHLATIHRAGNTDDPGRLREIFDALAEISHEKPVVVPLHPRTRKSLDGLQFPVAGLKIIEPVGYFDMLILEKNAARILTDSGGVQKEAFLLGVPCVTLRAETEWVETVESGWNILAGHGKKSIIEAAGRELAAQRAPSCYGAGKAAEIMVEGLLVRTKKNERGAGEDACMKA
jgi:UDP-N-acetylglucosamine 2-epimerase